MRKEKQVVAKFLLAMAYDRKEFKDKVREYLSGAMLEFYKARVASKNSLTKWVKHWNSEVRNLIDRSLVATMQHIIRGFKNRQRAFEEVIEELKKTNGGYQKAAEGIVKKDFKVPNLKIRLDSGDEAAFWKMVENSMKAVFRESYQIAPSKI